MSRGTRYSAFFHTALLLLAIFGLPSLFNATREMEPQSITVDILPLSDVSNVKPSEPAPVQKQEPKPEEKKEDVKPKPKTKTEEAAPTPKPVATPKENAKEPIKKEEEKKEKKKKEDDLDAVLKSVEENAKNTTEDKKSEKKPAAAADTKSKSDNYDSEIPLSLSEKDAIRSQFIRCWNMPAGAKDAQNLVVTLRVKVSQDGAVIDANLAKDEGRYASDNFFRAAVDSALRAVKLCSPLQNLPAEKYGTWKDMVLTFDPHDLLQ